MRTKWPENINDLLASESDISLGKRLGVARTTIMRLRHKLGIRCFKRPSVSEALQGLVNAVEGSKYPMDRVLVQAIHLAKQALRGAGHGEGDEER